MVRDAGRKSGQYRPIAYFLFSISLCEVGRLELFVYVEDFTTFLDEP